MLKPDLGEIQKLLSEMKRCSEERVKYQLSASDCVAKVRDYDVQIDSLTRKLMEYSEAGKTDALDGAWVNPVVA